MAEIMARQGKSLKQTALAANATRIIQPTAHTLGLELTVRSTTAPPEGGMDG